MEAISRHVLVGYTLRTEELEDGGRFFELCHVNQVEGNSIVIALRVAHSGNAERFISVMFVLFSSVTKGILDFLKVSASMLLLSSFTN